MTALIDAVLAEAGGWSALEAIAVGFALAYLVLAIRENVWCWVCAGISSAIFVGVFALSKLYMEAALNAFYFGMAIYGWRTWRRRDDAGPGDGDRPVVRWPPGRHAVAVIVVGLLAAANGAILAHHTDAAFPYLDSLTTWAALWTTFLVARKVLENWWYWLAIDGLSVWIFWEKGLALTAALFVVYLLLIPFGLVAWTRSLHSQDAARA